MAPPPPIVFIVGPTAVGKTDVGFLLAERLKGEIISCDAMQVYRDVTIATSKPSLAMRERVRHHLLDVVSVSEEFNVAQYNQLALAAITDIRKRNRIPLIVGGSGLYMSVLLDGIFEETAKDPQLRQTLEERAEQEGNEKIYTELLKVDALAATKIHPGDRRRILRALEVYYTTGQPISHLQKQRSGLWGKEEIILAALNRPRRELYDRINTRVLEMVAAGLVEEIRSLSKKTLSRTAAAIIGVKEIGAAMNGTCSLAEAQEAMQLNTRHLAKRQLTWFRKDKRLAWLDMAGSDSPENVADKIFQMLATAGR